MDKNTKRAGWLLVAIAIGGPLLIVHAGITGSTAFAIILAIGLIAFCCYGAYLSVQKKAADKEAIITRQTQFQNEYQSAIAPFYTDMREKYYALFHGLRIPTDAAKIDVETTVFGLPCKATPTAGQTMYYKHDFYMWKDSDAIFIFPTEDHLTDSHIKWRTRVSDLAATLDPNDIGVFKVDITDIEYYLVTGQKTSELRIEGGGSSGPNIKGAIIGGILAGEAGAIIGGMPEPKPVYSYTQHNENRCVELVYKKDGTVQKIKLSYPAFPFLEQWIPEKDYSYVVISKP